MKRRFGTPVFALTSLFTVAGCSARSSPEPQSQPSAFELQAADSNLRKEGPTLPSYAPRRPLTVGGTSVPPNFENLFVHATWMETGNNPQSVALGSLTGDPERVDIITANYCGKLFVCDPLNHPTPGTISVFLSNGDGSFQPRIDLFTSPAPQRVVVGDFDGDGHLDIATVHNLLQGVINVFYGNGDGTFGQPVVTQVGPYPFSLAAAKLVSQGSNAGTRGIDDLVVVNSNCETNYSGSCPDVGTVSVFLGNARRQLTKTQDLVAGHNPLIVAVGPLFPGGTADLAVTNFDDDDVSIFKGNGDGSFNSLPVVKMRVNSHPMGVALGDLDGDGLPDLAVTEFGNRDGTNVAVLPGHGDGSFGSPIELPVAFVPTWVSLADFNHDGKLDLAVAALASGEVSVILGRGGDQFWPATHYGTSTGPTQVAIGNLTGKPNSLDLVTSDASYYGHGMSILFGAGGGSFRARKDYIDGRNLYSPYAITAAQLSSGGLTDLATVDPYFSQARTFVADGHGGLSEGQTFPVGTNPMSLVAGDFSGGPTDDLVVADFGNQSTPGDLIDIRANNGQLGGQEKTTHLASNPYFVAKGDFNGDHQLDVVVANPSQSSLTVLLGRGDGTFSALPDIGIADAPIFVAVDDFNNDQKLDLIVALGNSQAGLLAVLFGNGDGTFQPARFVSGGTCPLYVAAGNLLGESHRDIAVANCDTGISILANDGLGNFSFTSQVNTPDVPSGLVVADFDGDSIQDIAVSVCTTYCEQRLIANNTVSVFRGLGQGQFDQGTSFIVGNVPIGLVAGAFDETMRPGLAVNNFGSSTTSLLLNGSLTITDP